MKRKNVSALRACSRLLALARTTSHYVAPQEKNASLLLVRDSLVSALVWSSGRNCDEYQSTTVISLYVLESTQDTLTPA